MDYIEHYFENLLFNKEDTINAQYLFDAEVHVIKVCADYILHKLFYSREDFIATIDYYEDKLGEDYLLTQRLKCKNGCEVAK
jgi:hypothetical protein